MTNQYKERFFSKVTKTGSCWNWEGAKTLGYGQMKYRGKTHYAHRISYMWAKGEIPNGMEVDHICHNRSCVNPQHLRLATSQLNKQNQNGPQRRTISGVRGVYWDKTISKWRAGVRMNYKLHNLGIFNSIDEAEAVVTEWRRRNMPYSVMDQERKAA